MFDNPTIYNPKWTSSKFKSIVIDNFKQIWFNEVSASCALQLYKNVKDCIGLESYLNILPKDLRFFVTRLRISAHSLRIQTDVTLQFITLELIVFVNIVIRMKLKKTFTFY